MESFNHPYYSGSGKTTQLPQYLMENFPDSRIVVTQPRRIAAISAAKRVLQEQRQKSSSSYYSSSSSSGSSSVGYAVRFDKQYSKSTQLVYMTDGLLLRECTTTSSASSLLSNFDIFVLDEAHERSLETDILFGVLKRAMDRRRLYIEEKEKKSSDLSINVEAASSPPPQKGPASSSSLVSLKPMKVIIMSATLDVEKFSGKRRMKCCIPKLRTANNLTTSFSSPSLPLSLSLTHIKTFSETVQSTLSPEECLKLTFTGKRR